MDNVFKMWGFLFVMFVIITTVCWEEGFDLGIFVIIFGAVGWVVFHVARGFNSGTRW